MRQGEKLYGFLVKSVRELPEQKAALYEMEYEKNGARLLWLDNGEENKLFSIAFKTLPWNDTGVFHILEHSVLGGSEKYPVKEPFLHMLKSSMNTFLNAMTFPDKTLYPVSSRNETDFMNLVDVYLDGVFHPTIYRSPFTFYQEGWHYELESPEAMPVYKGVVFNEMKGALSSVDARLMGEMNRLLFPDSCYRFESGGSPERIPDLTYQEFLEAHREYYHPSNAGIYLDGSVPIERVLALLDQYLSGYEKSGQEHRIPHQEPVKAVESTGFYAIGEEEGTEEQVHMAFGKLACDFSDRKKLMALAALSSYLTGILREGLAQDAALVVVDGIAQPICYLQICNTEYERRGRIKEIVRETVNRLLAEGLDRAELEAVISQFEFQAHEGDEPKGLGRMISVYNSWMYGGDPALYLEQEELFKELRKALDTDYYEKLLEEILLDQEHTAAVYMLPSLTKNQEELRAEQERLARERSSWSKEELQEILEMNRAFGAWQSEPDSAKAIGSLPVLSLEEIETAPETLGTVHRSLQGAPVLFHETRQGEVIHFNLYFSLADIPQEHWGTVSFMTNLLGLLPTKRHSAYELQREMKGNIGFLDYNIMAFSVPSHPQRCRPFFVVTCSVLKGKLDKALSLLLEILSETLYDGEESVGLMEEILMQCCMAVRQGLLGDGHRFALMRAASHSSAAGRFMEQAEGYSLYCWLTDLAEHFEERSREVCAYANQVQEQIFSLPRLTLSVTGDHIPDEFAPLLEQLDKPGAAAAPEYMTCKLEEKPVKELIQIPAGISYSASAGFRDSYHWKYSGSLRVLAGILSYDYLWNQVRVKGGAYGSGCQVGAGGNAAFYSYRDPAPLASLETYRHAGDFVEKLCREETPIDNYIISAVASSEPLVSMREEGLMADTDAMSGITQEDRARIRQEMLRTRREELAGCIPLLRGMAEGNSVCIVGQPDGVKEWGDNWKVFRL